MKKVLTICLATMMLLGAFALTALATPPLVPTAFVTIVDENGEIVLAAERIPWNDTDGQGPDTVTIAEMLETAHDIHFEGGAATGFASGESPYGISLLKLWGNESGSFGYYLNDCSPSSLADEVKPNDHIYAFVYTDTVSWTDTYSFFSFIEAHGEKGEEMTLTLCMTGFDENWNTVTLPVAGAVITVDGEKTDLITDENGQVAITYDKAGELVISAVHDTLNLRPPVLLAHVEGGVSLLFVALIVAAFGACAVLMLVIFRKKQLRKKE